MGNRLDTTLVQRGLVRSRTQAARLIGAGQVSVAGRVAEKAAMVVDQDADIVVDLGADWASRGAHKLLGALDAFRLDVANRRAIDVGASTGGFVDVLLRRGAVPVAAIDVGHGQLTPRLAADPRVQIYDGVNVRGMTDDDRQRVIGQLGGAGQIVVADVSFISLTLVLPAMVALASSDAHLLPMVKPQFEVGRDRLGAGGVVRDASLRVAAVLSVAECAAEAGWGVAGMTPSPLPGASGNVEYFLHLTRAANTDAQQCHEMIQTMVEGGPQ